MLTIFSEPYEKLIQLVFKIYDFDLDGHISRSDVKIVFSHIPILTKKKANSLKFKYEKEEYLGKVECQDEMNAYLDKMFSKNEILDEGMFKMTVEEVSSEPFLFVSYDYNSYIVNSVVVRE